VRPRRDDLIARFGREPPRGAAIGINHPQVETEVLPSRVEDNPPPVGRPGRRPLIDSSTSGELLRVRSVSFGNPDVVLHRSSRSLGRKREPPAVG
jgi:hypothetical protein